MSGIAGIFHLDGRFVDSSLLHRMIDCIPHRGDDGVKVWARGSIGLAHRQLWTTEESQRETQPASNHSCWITFDGRIDNRVDLIAWLDAESCSTDVELLLKAYERWGCDCLARVIGDFAFALWDASRQILVCGRDVYGIRPLYYRFAGADFVFGSEVLQIFQNPDIPMEVNQDAVAEWFTSAGLHALQYRDLHHSFFKGIQELPPAHYLLVDRRGPQLRRYWDLNPGNQVRYRSRQEYFDQFSQIFREAVRCRLRSQGPVGAELSGGFDSSSIVCVAQDLRSGQNNRSPLIAFSMVFDELSCDERPLIRSIVEKYDLDFCPVVADELCGLVNLSPETASLQNIDRPDQFALEKAGEVLYGLARERNVRVMLSGEGAENHVMGSDFVLDSLIRNQEWRELFRRLAVIKKAGSLKSSVGSLLRYGLAPLLPRNLSRSLYSNRFHPEFRQDRFPGFYTQSLISLIQSSHGRQKERLAGSPTFPGWARQLEYENLNPGTPLVRAFRQPVERRFPYHDRRLVEFCLAIPPEIKYQHMVESQRRYVCGRALQKEAFKRLLPEAILRTQRKVNFNDLYRRRFAEASRMLHDFFQPPAVPRIAELGFVDGERFWPRLADVIRGFRDSESVAPQTCLLVNRIVQLELWLRAVRATARSRVCPTNDGCAPEVVLAG